MTLEDAYIPLALIGTVIFDCSNKTLLLALQFHITLLLKVWVPQTKDGGAASSTIDYGCLQPY